MRCHPLLLTVPAIVAVMLLQSVPSVSASSGDGLFSIDIVDDEGNVITGKLTEGSPLSFDTDTDYNGTRYKLRSSATIDCVPMNLMISSESGKFKVKVTAVGLSSFLLSSGLKLSLGGGLTAELDSSNDYSSNVVISGKEAVLEPNRPYPITISTLHGVETTIEPDTAESFTLSFSASMSDGYHHITFISKDRVVETRIMNDGEMIEPPSLKGSLINEVKGWYTDDGKQIYRGYILGEDDGDIIATAEWAPSKTAIAAMATGAICAAYLAHIFRRGVL